MDYVSKAKRYAKDVLSNKIIACELVHCACQRFVNDLKKSESEDYPYYLDNKVANKVCSFAELMTHSKGQWAIGSLDDRRIHLEDWQCFIFVNIFGWLKKKDHKRRFNEVYIEVARKNGKSVFASVIGLFCLVADSEPSPEVYCAATSMTQAKEVFNPAKNIVDADADFREYYGINSFKSKITCDLTHGTFEKIVARPKDGASPHCAIMDELHEHPDSLLFDSQKRGMGARSQPLMVSITTAGNNYYSFCKEKHDEMENVLTGVVPNDRVFPIIYTIDKDDYVFTEDKTKAINILRKANPNFGVSVSEEFLLDELENARNYPSKQNGFLIKYCDKWTMSDSAFFNMVKWRDLEDKDLTIEDCKGLPCFMGLDLASKLDLCCISLVFVDFKGDDRHYYIFQKSYIPSKQLEPECKNAEIYRRLVNDGNLETHEGAETNHKLVLEQLLDYIAEYKPKMLCEDKYQAQFINDFVREKFKTLPIVEVGQNAKEFTPPMREVEAGLESGRVHHNGDLTLSWCFSNVVAHEDKNQNVFPNKKNIHSKIDSAIATLNALSQAMRYKQLRSTTMYRIRKL